MAGHSHAKNVRLRKAAVDSKRSKLFSKMSRQIITAARLGGGDPKANYRLSFAIEQAKAVSVPKDTIDKAIKKGTGELDDGESFEEIVYEGYGPGGVAVLCDIMTDNRNRTAGEIRKIFDVSGGNLGTTGCVNYLFQRKGQFFVAAEGHSEEELMELLLEAGADDLKLDGDEFEILCDPADFDAVLKTLEEASIHPKNADIVALADILVPVAEEDAAKVLKLLDALDDHDDVQNVYSNADLPESAYAEAEA